MHGSSTEPRCSCSAPRSRCSRRRRGLDHCSAGNRQPPAPDPAPGSPGSISTIPTNRTLPPEPFRSRYADEPYDGEIAYADAALGSSSSACARRRARPHAGRHRLRSRRVARRARRADARAVRLRRDAARAAVMWAEGPDSPGRSRTPMRLVDVTPTVLDLVGARRRPASTAAACGPSSPASSRSMRPARTSKR